MIGPRRVRVTGELYGGTARTDDPAIQPPFVVRHDVLEVSPEGEVLRVAEPAAERVTPRCVHFGTCGGCQYQMIDGRAQGDVKRRILLAELEKAGIDPPARTAVHTAEPYGYRNRVRLRIAQADGGRRFGYHVRGTTTFLPIVMCPISAPPLLLVAEALFALANSNRDAEHWLNATMELELFVNDDLSRVQATLFCAARTRVPQGALTRVLNALRAAVPSLAGLAAEAFDPRTGPTGRTLDVAGAAGLPYTVALENAAPETYWISRGGFFQVNRFLLPKLVELVTRRADGTPRSGSLAWDLFAGVGLFSRVLARSFAQITAVEGSSTAAADLSGALGKQGRQHRAVAQATLAFLQEAVVQRERPELIVLDPPRAGAGDEACSILLRLAPAEIVYVSCDPTTLARDLRVLLGGGYQLQSLDVVDMFAQTFHLETVAVLRRHP